MALTEPKRRLCRSRDSYVGGVCAGIAEYYNLDTLVVRILAILLTVMTFGLVGVLYLVMWAHVPLVPQEAQPVEIEPEEAVLSEHGTLDYCLIRNDQGEEEWIRLPLRGLSTRGRIGVLLVLIALFALLTLGLTQLVPGVEWWRFLPLLPLIFGLFFIVVPVRSRFSTAWVAGGVIVASASAGLFPMSLGVVSWESLSFAFELFWPIVVVALVLFIMGLQRSLGALALGGSCCFVLFCVLASAFCVLPGEVEALTLPFLA